MEPLKDTKIKLKLRKIKELADRGYKGEAIAAKQKLQILLNKYNISVEEIEEDTPDWHFFKTPKNKDLRNLLFQCYRKILDTNDDIKFKSNSSGIYLNLTGMQSIELYNLYNWHKRKFNEVLKEHNKVWKEHKDVLFTAYIHKNKIYADTIPQSSEKTDTKYLKKVLKAMNGLKDNKYYKELQNK